MLLASLLLPLAVIAIVLLVQRLHLPVFLAIMATVVVYGIAADMTFMSVGKAFGLGFTAAIEQTGLLVVAGALVSALVLRQPLGTGTAAAAGALAGLGASATGGLALLQPAGQDAPRRALGLALTLLAFAALATPSPLAVAAASVMKIPPRTLAMVGLPLAVIAALLGWWHVSRQVPASKIAGHAGWAWPPLLLAVGAAGGLSRVFDETGMAELLAEHALHPRYGILTPFLAAAIVKTMQGNSLSAILTASGMAEPMLPALGLDSAMGRVLAAAAVGAGSMAICHVNDPFFWIAASMARLSPGRALYVVSLGSVVMALGALVALAALRQFL